METPLTEWALALYSALMKIEYIFDRNHLRFKLNFEID